MEPPPEDPLAGFPVTIVLPVQWGDQDAFRHVNNTVFLRWFESSRVVYTRRVGLFDLLEAEDSGPILASIRCDYRRPLTYPDSVRVGTRVARIGRTSLALEHRVFGEAARAVAAEGSAVLVFYDYARAEPRPIPDRVREAIRSLEGKAL